MYRNIWHAAVLFILAAFLSGCIAAPIVALANLAHKSGTMSITLQGPGNALHAFREAAIKNGGTIPSVNQDFARAEFSDVDMKVEAQMLPEQTIIIRGASLSNSGRTYMLKDSIGEITENIAQSMQAAGFVIKDRKRDRGI